MRAFRAGTRHGEPCSSVAHSYINVRSARELIPNDFAGFGPAAHPCSQRGAMGAARCNREDFPLYAERCDRMVEERGLAPQYCDDLRAMARGWRHLAAEEERIARMLGEIDLLFIDLPDADPPRASKTWRRLQ